MGVTGTKFRFHCAHTLSIHAHQIEWGLMEDNQQQYTACLIYFIIHKNVEPIVNILTGLSIMKHCYKVFMSLVHQENAKKAHIHALVAESKIRCNLYSSQGNF